jgi:Zn-dependent M28 family amino/carboxypeptidase
LGAGHPVGINVGGDETVLKLLQPVADVLSTSGAALLRSSDETGADIIPLKVAGVPTFSPIQDARTYFDYHHTAADTLDKIDPRELRENAAVVAVLAYALATMDAELPRQPQPVPDWLK